MGCNCSRTARRSLAGEAYYDVVVTSSDQQQQAPNPKPASARPAIGRAATPGQQPPHFQDASVKQAPNLKTRAPAPAPTTAAAAAAAPQRELRDRVVRVFLSSTFKDMQPEREALFRSAVARLRRALATRGLFFTPVDLRVTEHEILLGAFVNPDGTPNVRRQTSLFYFSNEALAAPDAGKEGPHATRCLAELKARIRASGVPVRSPDYASAEELAAAIHDDLLALELVASRPSPLSPPSPLALVVRDYPDAGPRPWLEEERAAHAAFAAARRRLYLPAPDDFEALNAYAAASGTCTPPQPAPPRPASHQLTPLLANWAAAWQDAHPGDAVVLHFVGGAPRPAENSARASNLMRRVVEEMKALGSRAAPPELTGDEASDMHKFAEWLGAASPPRRLVLAVDAVDQLLADNGAQRLPWLPHAASPRLRLVLSCTPGEASAAAAKRAHLLAKVRAERKRGPLDIKPVAYVYAPDARLGRPRAQVAPLDAARRRALIAADLRQASKGLPEVQLARLAGAPQAANPLFLTVALELLREHGMAEAELQQLLGVGGARPEPGGPAPAQARTPLVWAEFLAAASSALVDRNGLLGFFHRAAAEQITEGRFGLGRPEERRRAHARLGAFFAAQPPSERRAEESAWQLERAGDKEALVKNRISILILIPSSVTSTREFEAALPLVERSVAMREAAARPGGAGGGGEGTREYGQARLGLALSQLAGIRVDRGEYDKAHELYKRVLEIQERTEGAASEAVTKTLSNLAETLFERGKYAEAEAVLRRALRIAEQARPAPPRPAPPRPAPPRPRGLKEASGAGSQAAANARLHLASALQEQGRFDEAKRDLSDAGPLARRQRALEVREGAYGPEQPAVAQSLRNLANEVGQPAAPPRPKIPARPALSRPAPPRAERVLALAAQLQLQARFDEAEELLRVRPRGI
eukprot:tig00001001_g6195.t1